MKKTTHVFVMFLLAVSLATPGHAAPVRSAEDALSRIVAVVNRPSRSPAQQQQNITTALAMLAQFRHDYPEPANQASAAFLSAQCYVGLEDYAQALGEIDRALALPLDATYTPTAHYLRGRILLRLRRNEEGAAALRWILTSYPDHEIAQEARVALAQALAEDGDAAQAVALLDTVVRVGQPAWAVQAARAMLPTLRLIGTPAPAFDVEAIDGRRLSLEQYRGKVVLLDFWATWCPPCREAMPKAIALYNQYHSRGFEIIGISLDHSRTALTEYVRSQHIAWRQVYEGRGWNSSLAKLYDVNAIPKTFLLDRQGRIGGVDLRSEQLEAAIERLLSRR